MPKTTWTPEMQAAKTARLDAMKAEMDARLALRGAARYQAEAIAFTTKAGAPLNQEEAPDRILIVEQIMTGRERYAFHTIASRESAVKIAASFHANGRPVFQVLDLETGERPASLLFGVVCWTEADAAARYGR